MPLAVPPADDALDLMRQAIVLLDQTKYSMSADFLQHAISLLEEERWAAAGFQAAHRLMQ